MIALFDVGNTHTHLGLANSRRVVRRINLPTAGWGRKQNTAAATSFFGDAIIDGGAFCSVVPTVSPLVARFAREKLGVVTMELDYRVIRGIGVDYPRPETIGADRLANALAARHHYGAPVVVVDFGTAVTFDVVDRRGNYVGGIIAPGLNVMTDYLHEKTALLPRIRIRDVKTFVGKSTEEAMTIGAVHGYRGLVAGLVRELKRALGSRRMAVVATGGYARLIGAKLPQITAIEPLLTLEGLRLAWEAHRSEAQERGGESPCLLCRD